MGDAPGLESHSSEELRQRHVISKEWALMRQRTAGNNGICIIARQGNLWNCIPRKILEGLDAETLRQPQYWKDLMRLAGNLE